MPNFEDLIMRDTRANQPAAGTYPGRLYFVTDEQVLERDNGSSWEDYSVSGSGGGYDEGSSFPGSPSSGDKFYRSDRNMLYFYDGTRWLTTQIFLIELKMEENVTWPNSVDTLPVHRGSPPFGGDYDVYLLDWHFMSSVLTTNNGTNYWNARLYKFNSAGGGDTLVAQVNTSADTAGSAYNKKVAINALLGSYVAFYTDSDKILSPGTFRYHGGHITCRLVG